MNQPALRRPIQPGETRNPERLHFHYGVEKELAQRLKQASRNERSKLYPSVYDELFSRVEDHPGRTRTFDSSRQQARVNEQLRNLERFLQPTNIYLEIGMGNGALAIQVASRVKKVYGVEVSRKVLEGVTIPDNMEVLFVEGVELPVPSESVDVVYSNQLMEHLHEDDAHEQLRNVHRSLKKGGKYICVTPNRITGPHDISGYFEPVAAGLHLKEYTSSDLCGLMQRIGFREATPCYLVRGRLRPISPAVVRSVESMLQSAPDGIRLGGVGSRLVCHCVIGTK